MFLIIITLYHNFVIIIIITIDIIVSRLVNLLYLVTGYEIYISTYA